MFASEALHFDTAEGSFRIDQPDGPTVAIEGGDVTAKWTGRALERLGCRVVAESAEADMRVRLRSKGNEFYEVERERQTSDYATFAELLEALRREQVD